MLKLYNTLTRSIEEFKPLVEKQVGMYTCGPTVYDRAHIGNMKTNVMSDILVRTLRFLGYEVNALMNITDIDDRMIERADREGISLSELAAKFENVFFEDLNLLNIEPADTYPRATEHFPEMKSLLNTLIEKGYAYERDGEVYYDISKFKDYGKLSQLDKREIRPGARVAVDNYDKNNVNDFVLWKIDEATKAHAHEETRGGGRPGWHLECSAMSMKYLGPTLDIHAGGVDLLFPHHENEIAQSEAATEKPYVRYFVHGEFLLIDGQKMSKSLNNFYTLGDIQEKGIDPLAYRYLLLTSHYRSKLNFTWDSLAAAAKALESVRQLTYRAQNELTDEQRRQYLERGMAALENDLDTPKLLAILHEADNYDLWLAFEPVLGLGLTEAEQIPAEVEALFQKRQQARDVKDFVAADELRGQIEDRGYLVEDTATGSRLVAK
jgi:cysteinyl-tRNA synthetase